MIEKMTPGMLRDLADLIWGRDLPTPPNYLAATVQIEIAEGLRNSAARREAVDRDVSIPSLGPTEDAPPAADLVARLRAMQHMDPCYPTPHPLCIEAAAAIEAMRAERDAVLSLIPPEFLDPPDGGEVKPVELVRHVVARVKALEGVLDKYRAGIVTHVQMTGPVFGGTNSRQLKIAFEADQALAAGGADA